jgi:nitronate monooxygenase
MTTPALAATPWSRALGLEVPIVNAPMGGAAGGALAAAVSAAGGLGMIGVGGGGSVELIIRESEIPRRQGVRFGIGLLAWAVEREPALLDAAVDAAPLLVSVSFGYPDSWIARLHDAGILAATQVYDVATARRAEGEGVDVVVARGSEGGGHGRNGVATLPLLQALLDDVTVPVLAAGGIGSSRGLAAVLAAGAAGAWLGTPFLACPESLLSPKARARVLGAGENDTTYTRAFDVALGNPWPTEFGERVLTNRFSEEWTGREDELPGDPSARRRLAAARTAEDFDVADINAGQGVGLVRQETSAADVVEELARGAAALLSRWGPSSEPGAGAT